MSKKINFTQARFVLKLLENDVANLAYAGVAKPNPIDSVKANYSLSEDGRTMTVVLPWLGLTALAQARPV